MRKVIGIGETILDILFRNNQPTAAVPGGSVFNAIVSLARLGVKTCFISEVGDDHVGRLIKAYMQDNNIATDHIDTYAASKSPVSLAFLNDNNEAAYSFYKDYPEKRLDVDLPEVEKDDIVMIGSYYSVTPALRSKHLELLDAARDKGAIVFYDFNFRYPHKSEALKLASYMLENMEYAGIVRGSADDFMCLYDMNDADRIYNDKIRFYCRNFVYTQGSGNVSVRTDKLHKDYPIKPITTVSTVGAGDNFNAGLLFGLLRMGIGFDDLGNISERQWDEIVAYGITLASEACLSYGNSISVEFAAKIASADSNITLCYNTDTRR